jgi:hypothetical protein
MSDTTIVAAPISLAALPTLDGQAVDDAALRGRKVLVFMWGSW